MGGQRLLNYVITCDSVVGLTFWVILALRLLHAKLQT